jgi:hypothetical protein
MKKLIVLFFLLSLSVGMMAQRAGTTTTLPWNVNTKTLTLLPVDSVTQHATVYWTFLIDRPKLQYFTFAVAIDTVGALNGKAAFDIQGSLDGTNWIATAATQVRPGATATGLAVDTAFVLSDVSTGVLWKYLRLKIVNSGTLHVRGFRVSGLAVKVADK